MGIESMVSSLPMLMSMLPLLMQATQIMFNLFFLWFFGSMAMRGYRGRKPFPMKTVGTLLVGSLCLVGGAAFSGFIPFVGSGILSIMQLDILIAGLLVSIVLAVALHLITHNNPSRRPEEMVDMLRRKVVTLEEMLKTKARHIAEADVRKIAEDAMKGYGAVTAKLIGNEYEVGMKRDKNEGKVIIDAWDGEIKNRIMHESGVSRFFRDTHKVAGFVMIIVVILASAVFFEGFSDPNEQLASMFGLSV
ncbi:MAG: hypothetical protein KAT35_02760, partial [Candidatus Aenigmarchaeota archaeon]|nr:hypothetical protein [Candidatus Aenigmarchaeota archaeon]